MALDSLEDESQCHRLNPAACAHSLPPSPPHCWFSLPSSPLPSLSLSRSLSCPDFICLLIYFSSNNPPRSHFAASMYRTVLDAVNGVSCVFSIYLAVNTKKFMHAAAWLTALPTPHSESVVPHPLLNEWFVSDIPCVFIFIYSFFRLPEGSFLRHSFLSSSFGGACFVSCAA